MAQVMPHFYFGSSSRIATPDFFLDLNPDSAKIPIITYFKGNELND